MTGGTMNLAICIPISWDFVPTPFVISLTQLMRPGQLKAIRELGVERYFYLFNRAFPLDYNRNTLVKKALDLDADWTLFLDADMTFPPDLVSSLIKDSLESGASIVSGCYFKKLPPHACVSSLMRAPHDPQLLTPIDSTEKGLVECDVIGMGAALIHCDVFEAIPYPWFEYEVYEKTGERTVTEDVPFCRKAKEAGFSILTDTSLVCGHVRQVEVDDSHWSAYREKLKDKPGYDPPVVKEMC
jgi:glycosyltransferase involved in cell wall biosynthesis